MAVTAEHPAAVSERDLPRTLWTAAWAGPLAYAVLALAGRAMQVPPGSLGDDLLGLLPLLLVSVQLVTLATQARRHRQRRLAVALRRRQRDHAQRASRARARVRDAELDRARQLRAAFLSCLTHEVRTPMDGILGMTELALATELSSDQEQLLGAARDSTHALLAVVDGVLDHERLASGAARLGHAPFDLEPVVTSALGQLARRGAGACRNPVCHLAPELATRRVGDEARLAQVLVALGLAAGQRAQGSSLVFDLRPGSRADELLVSITDGGQHPDASVSAVSLQPFAESDDLPGLSMELGVACAVARLMGGELLERGSRSGPRELLARLPCALQDDDARPLHTSRGRRVVLADEDLVRRQTLARSLGELGARVQEVDSLRQALELLEQGADEPALVLADEAFPGLLRLAEVCQQVATGPRLVRLLAAGHGGDGPDTLARPLLPGRLARLLHERPSADGDGSAPSPAASGTEASPGDRHANAHTTQPSSRTPGSATGASRMPPARTVSAGAPERSTQRAMHQPESSSAQCRPLRLLLAEDTAVSREVARRMLEAWGHTVWLARDGREALEIHAEQEIDAVLMDVSMPVMDGLEATASLRAREQGSGRHLPIVAMTAHAGPDDRRRCLAAGMDDFVTKPVRAAELFAVLERLPVQPSARDSTWSTSNRS